MGDVHDSCRLREVTGLSPTSSRRHRGNWYLTTTQTNLPTAEFLVGTGPTNVHWTSCSSSSCSSSSRHLIVVIMIIRSSLQINCQAASLTRLHTQPQDPICPIYSLLTISRTEPAAANLYVHTTVDFHIKNQSSGIRFTCTITIMNYKNAYMPSKQQK